jgi:ankyrin repeat protein
MTSHRFRYVFCQLEVLRQCLPPSIRNTLAELPESLDETYERVLQQVPKSNRVYSHRLLQCLVVAVRPLRVEELVEVLAIDFSTTAGSPKLKERLRLRWEDQEQAVLSACSCLITIVKHWDLRIVQFSHFSVKEFLTSERLAASEVDTLRNYHIRLEPAHTIMAQVCLGVLLRLDNSMGRQTIGDYPLAKYSGEHFGDHAGFEDVISQISNGVDDLLDQDKPHLDTWLWLQIGSWNSERWYNSSFDFYMHGARLRNALVYDSFVGNPRYPPRVAPLYYVAALGHLCLVRRLVLTRPQDIRARDNKGCTPLHIAVLAKRVEVSQFLIQHSEDLDTRDSEDRTLLHMAAYKGLFEIARILLEHDGDTKGRINARYRNGQTPLHLASRNNFSNVVALLLKFGASVDEQDNDNTTPLLCALQSSGCGTTAQLLLDHGATTRVRDKFCQTPLHRASQRDLPNIVTLLLQTGADVDAQDNDDMTPLLWAIKYSMYGTAVPVLLEYGASVHVRTKKGQTPLHIASKRGLSDVVALLLKFGADAEAQDVDKMTPLFYALQSQQGESETASQLLLDHGASVHARDNNGRTPLHPASQNHSSNLMALLLKLGADVDAQDDNNITPLLGALEFSGGGTAAQLLLNHHASVQVRNKNGQTPLHLASRWGLSDVVALLLQLGADVDAQDDDMMTPLLCSFGSEGFISVAAAQLLLDHGASVHVRNKNGQTPLHLASKRNFSNIITSLLKLGAYVDARDNYNMTPLLEALQGWGGDSAAQLLLEHGASVRVRDNSNQTPLHFASGRRFSDVLALLAKVGVEVDAQDDNNMTPLLFASLSGSVEAAEALLNHGADVHARNKNGQTPLHLASQHGRSSLVALLLKFGADVDARDNDRMTPLHFAYSSQQMFIENDDDDDDELEADEEGEDLKVIKLLLEHGANVHSQNDSGKTPSQLASSVRKMRRSSRPLVPLIQDD